MKVTNESALVLQGGATLSRDFFKNCIKNASAEHVKIYLYLKFMAENSIDMSVCEISEATGESLDVVSSALAYWAQEKMLVMGSDTVTLTDGGGGRVASEAPRSYSGKEIARFVESDKVFADLYKKSETILGRMLSTNDINTIFSLYNWLGMDPGVICLLLEFCADNGKTNMKYIEKTAIGWDEENIRTVSDAVEYINRVRKMRTYLNSIIRILGIGDRKLTNTETTKIAGWQSMGLSPEMVQRAYEITVARTGKYALSYMDKILVNWAENNVFTPEAADEFDEKFRQRNQKQSAKPAPVKPQQSQSAASCTDYDKIARDAAVRAIENAKKNED